MADHPRDIVTTAALRAQGFGSAELSRLVRSSELVHLRRGAYAHPEATLSGEDLHRALVLATVPMLAPDAAVSHVSAAVLHRLPLLDRPPARVQVTRSSVRGGKDRGGVHLHASPLGRADVVRLDGTRVTSPARTVVDLARSVGLEAATVAGDAALAAGLSVAEIEDVLANAGRRPGIAKARHVLALLDGRSESPGESRSRLALIRAGLPAPELQHEVRDGRGRVVARCDFAWPERRTIGEFDGRIKYGRLLRPGRNTEDVLFREKLREDLLRDLGWQVVRWVWRDLDAMDVVVDRLLRAFARAGTPL